MDVIPFPQWRAWFYTDEYGRNVVRLWLDEHEVPDPDRNAIQALLDICEYSGPEALSYCTLDLDDGFYALKCKHAGGIEMALVYYLGPFGPSEVTFLACAEIEGKKLRPSYVRGVAEENLEKLGQEPKRRRREPVT